MAEEIVKIKITDKDTVTNVPSSAKVFINDSGAVKQVDASKMILKKTRVNLGDITVGSSGYTDISGYIPTDITVVFAGISNWTITAQKTAFAITADGKHIIGTAGDVITQLRIDYYYY